MGAKNTPMAGGQPSDPSRIYLEMNEALLLGSVRQHQQVLAADEANRRLEHEIIMRKQAQAEILSLNARLEQRVAERTAELQNVNAELEAFSYSVAHDLRAPLRHVLGFAEILHQEGEPPLSGKSLEHLERIVRAAKKMGKLIDDLLAFSRNGKAEIQKTPVNLGRMINVILDDFQEETKDQKITWDIGPLPVVMADRALLGQVMANLISNAVKFSRGRAGATIQIGCVPGGDAETVIFIRDNGVGFDQQYAGKLFGVFQRLHSEKEFEGTGIGLANVRRIIHRHGGRTWAEGIVGGGATFYFSIPAQLRLT